MAKAARISVTNAATLIAGKPAPSYDSIGKLNTGTQVAVGAEGSYIIRNDSGTTVDIGGSDVTSGGGLALLTASSITVAVGPGEGLYAIGPSAGPFAIQVLKAQELQD